MFRNQQFKSIFIRPLMLYINMDKHVVSFTDRSGVEYLLNNDIYIHRTYCVRNFVDIDVTLVLHYLNGTVYVVKSKSGAFGLYLNLDGTRYVDSHFRIKSERIYLSENYQD